MVGQQFLELLIEVRSLVPQQSSELIIHTNMQKQTVKIFLVEGNPTGLRTLELFNWNGKGYIIPRDRLELALEREEIKTQGVYILVGEGMHGQLNLYVGESEDVSNRLRSHNKSKDFWNTAIIFFSKDENLNKAHIKFLEELLIKEITDAGRATLENGNQPQKTKLSEADESEVLIFAENMKLILASIGYTFIKKAQEYEKDKMDTYLCVGPNAYASGKYTTEGMVVSAGSFARKNFVESVKDGDSIMSKQFELIASGILITESDSQLKFTRDYVFASPSLASSVVLARSSNGWTNWKREIDGKSLDQIFRQK